MVRLRSILQKIILFKASGNVVVKQGDSIELYSEILDYDGNKRKIIAREKCGFQ